MVRFSNIYQFFFVTILLSSNAKTSASESLQIQNDYLLNNTIAHDIHKNVFFSNSNESDTPPNDCRKNTSNKNTNVNKVEKISIAPSSDSAQNPVKEKKPWTFIVYAAADNNLRDYASRNIKQMSTIGSNSNINIVVHLDIRLVGQKKMTRRYYIEKNNPVQVDMVNEKTPMDSGDPQTLISACQWAIQNYPADHYFLVLWNHGTGIIDPYGRRQFDTNMLYVYNAQTNSYELDRNIGFLDLIEAFNDPKGICWDDSTGNYLTNQKLEFALQEIVSKPLKGKKFDIIAFDACLMSMIEIAQITKQFANIQISSQEVEPGPGWKYDEALSLFITGAPEPTALARHIVDAFAKAYKPYGNHPGFVDFTQSALDLKAIETIEINIDKVSELLLQGIQSGHNVTYKNIITLSRNKKNITHFNEPTYVDLHHFYTNLLKNIKQSTIVNLPLSQDLLATLTQGLDAIKKAVIHTVSGSNLPHARGISIFFPERKIHPSYKKSNFAKNNWVQFLTSYILG